MTAVADAIAELQAVLPGLELQREGLTDFAALDLQPETAAVVSTLRQGMDARLALCQAARSALQNLLDDGYPTLQTLEVGADVLGDLESQVQSLTAALQRVTTGPAATATITFMPAPADVLDIPR